MRRLVIVTGLSGAGKSQAMKSLEDFGFACVDNTPPVLARPFVALAEEASLSDAALALDGPSVHSATPRLPSPTSKRTERVRRCSFSTPRTRR